MNREDALWADALLVDVRQQADPTEQDAARNFAGIERRLHLDAPGGDAANGTAGNGAAASTGTLLRLRPEGAPPVRTAPGSVAASGWKSAAVLGRWLAFGATSALIGYLGGRADSRQELAELEQQLALARGQEQLEQRQLEQRQIQPPPSPLPHTQPVAQPQSAKPRAAAERPARRAPVLLRAARPPEQPPAQAAKPQPRTNEQLREAIRLLSRAEAELREGDAFAASLLLSDLDRTTPAALLREERLATSVLVACALDQAERARAALRELEQHNPQSIYRARLEGTCAEKTRATVSKEPVTPH
jgi:hypothetical protein